MPENSTRVASASSVAFDPHRFLSNIRQHTSAYVARPSATSVAVDPHRFLSNEHRH